MGVGSNTFYEIILRIIWGIKNMDQILVQALPFILIPIALGLLLSCIVKSNNEEALQSLTKEHVIVHLPKAYLWVGVITFCFSGLFIFMGIFYPNGTEKAWTFFGFGLFMLLGVIIIVQTLVWRIDVFRHESYFIYRNMFGKKRKIQYMNCKSYQYKTNTVIVETDKRKIHIDDKAANFEVLLAVMSINKIKEIK